MAKEFLARHGVEFVSHDIQRPEVIAELVDRGFRTVPVAFVDGVGYPGFDPDALRRALDLDGPANGAAPSGESPCELLPTVLAAWSRAVRQLPPHRAEPVEARAEVYGILQHVAETMAAGSTGVWDFDAAHSGDEQVRGSDCALIEWVDGLEAAVGAWLPTLTPARLGHVCSGHYGTVPLLRLIDISCARAVFPLGRFYAHLGELGVEPAADALSDEFLQQHGSPRITSERA